MNWLYWMSIAMLWIATGANLCSLIRSIRFQRRWDKTYNDLFSELQQNIDGSRRAERAFLEAAKTYREMREELYAELEVQEDNHDEV